MEDKPKEKWYFRTSAFVIALLCIGPFALPLAWANPRWSRLTKVGITVIVLVATYLLVKITASSIKSLLEYYKEVLG